MTIIAPAFFKWDAERSIMVPLRPKLADKTYTDQEIYRLAPIEERSTNSHNHFFAALSEAHANLPDDLVKRHPTPNHLRKYALIRVGYFNSRSIACKSPEIAEKVAAFIATMDEFAIVTVEGDVVTIYTAKSQDYRSMGRADFQDSKQKVLDFVASLVGVSASDLQSNAGKAA